jgi:probable HAF family extracellular repeat protein
MLVFAIVTVTGIQGQNIYRATTVGAGTADGASAYVANALNNSGEVVGYYRHTTNGMVCDAFLYSGGTTRDFGSNTGIGTAINNAGRAVGYTGCMPPSGFAYPYLVGLDASPSLSTGAASGINDGGQVVGSAQVPPGVGAWEAFLYSDGVMTGLGLLPGGHWSWAYAINNSGQIVGTAESSVNSEAFLYSGGVMTGLGFLPQGQDSWGAAINDRGQVVGSGSAAANWEAFLYSDGVMTGLGYFSGGSISYAYAINNSSQIVGSSDDSSGVERPFLYSGGRMYDLNSLIVGGAADTPRAATGINESGQIIVNASVTAYLLTPVHGLFVPIGPCRVADTRNSPGPFGGPALAGGSPRSFAIPQSACGVPATAQAYSLNVTVVPQRPPLSYLTLWPTGMDQPLVSTLNSYQGSIVANAAIVPAGQDGAVSVYVTDPTDLILDINGYFDAPSGDSFYAVPPCRLADTRLPPGSSTDTLRGPSMDDHETRDFPVLSTSCGLPATAAAYSTNVTVIPAGLLSFLTTWPTGQPQPLVSTLNALNGGIVANAAIVPAGTNGSVSVYVTNRTDVVLDTNGYFAPTGNTGALTFYPVTPCRVADTREADGPVLKGGTLRSFTIPDSDCSIPATAAAYSLNVTAVPDGPLGFLTAWPTGLPLPFVSTLNSPTGTVTANAAIVPAGANGAISVYVTNQTHVIVDINGYFAP